MAKKEFKLRGKTIDEIKSMGLEEFALLLDARKRRTLKRGLTPEQKTFLEKLKKKNVVKTHCRDMIIVPEMLGRTILLHVGNKFQSIIIKEEMLGHYLGEFGLTKNRVKHSAPGVGATKSSSAVSVR